MVLIPCCGGEACVHLATPESYTDEVPASRRFYHVEQVLGIEASRNLAPGPPVWGLQLGVELTTPPGKTYPLRKPLLTLTIFARLWI